MNLVKDVACLSHISLVCSLGLPFTYMYDQKVVVCNETSDNTSITVYFKNY